MLTVELRSWAFCSAHGRPCIQPLHHGLHACTDRYPPKKHTNETNTIPRQILREGPTELAAGQATSKVCPLCLSLPQGAEHPEAGGSGKLWEWVLNFLSPSSLCGRRQHVPFLHRFLAKNKQTKAGSKQGPLQAAGN